MIPLLVLMVALLVYFIWRMVTGRSSRTSTKDWLLYLLIAPLMILAFFGFFLMRKVKESRNKLPINGWAFLLLH